MEFQEFEKSIVQVHVHRPDSLTYSILGLVGEAGEVAEAYKKAMRCIDPVDVPGTCAGAAMIDELGDVLWYLTKVAMLLGTDLESVARANMVKLADRRENGK